MRIEQITYRRIAGEGKTALYNLYCNTLLCAEAITWDELMEKITNIDSDDGRTGDDG